jgi:hypothetical protein
LVTEKEDGGPAFPIEGKLKVDSYGDVVGFVIDHQRGMTLRDYFAAHCPITFTEFLKGWKRPDDANTEAAFDRFAELRLEYAAAMLKARQS